MEGGLSITTLYCQQGYCKYNKTNKIKDIYGHERKVEGHKNRPKPSGLKTRKRQMRKQSRRKARFPQTEGLVEEAAADN